MNENHRDSRLVSGDGPVNRRTVGHEHLKDYRQQNAVSPEAIARAERSQARSHLGLSLEDQIQSYQAPTHEVPQALQIISAIVLACGVITALLAWLQASPFTGATALGLMALGGLGLLRAMKQRSRRRAAQIATVAEPIFEKKSLRSFDDALNAAAPELSPAVNAALRQIKTSLANVAQHAGPHDEHFTQDDRMFLVECLRRYIPDSLEAYLRIPRKQRDLALLPGAGSAETALTEQLALLQSEIENRDKKIGRSAAENLLKQQRFLDSKKTR